VDTPGARHGQGGCRPASIKCLGGTLKQAANRVTGIHNKLTQSGCNDAVLPTRSHAWEENIGYLRRNWALGQPLINAAGDIRSIWYYHASGLLDLLMVVRAFDAGDARYKVYALLGIAEVSYRG
jgi:hypothetical protein